LGGFLLSCLTTGNNMQNNIIWEGINDESLENCNVLTNNNGCQANSTVPVAEEENA